MSKSSKDYSQYLSVNQQSTELTLSRLREQDKEVEIERLQITCDALNSKVVLFDDLKA